MAKTDHVVESIKRHDILREVAEFLDHGIIADAYLPALRRGELIRPFTMLKESQR